MVMLYEGGLKKLTTTRYPVYPVMSYSVSRMGYVVGYVVNLTFVRCHNSLYLVWQFIVIQKYEELILNLPPHIHILARANFSSKGLLGFVTKVSHFTYFLVETVQTAFSTCHMSVKCFEI
jgi:hypothetical protein